ncbi:hypothetical protein Q5P01_017244 [Channa striata]|uniref:Uncharacterized protein n=1 Tax=Channa striata TaxID=64152 RepID=A0AA88M965_CHASR|nr:hypothetical protein Q5P01_017244 [Channa striata]
MDKRKKVSNTELRLMVVGSSGPSQFLLTNAILGREEFSKDITSISGSRKNIGELAGRRVVLINGPNIYDKDLSRAKRKMELRRSICLCIPGPHAFLVAFDIEKISPNDMRTSKLMRERFGRHCVKHCMVLLACEDNVEEAALEHRVQKNWHLRELIEKYGGRFHLFNKNWRDRGRDRELLQKIEWMVASLGGGYFSSRAFQKAEDSVKKEEKRLRKQRAAEIEKAWTEMEKQYIAEELYHRKDAYTADVGAEIRAKAEMDNGWLRTSIARGLGIGFVVGAVMGTLFGLIEGPGGMVLYGIIGGAVGGSAGGTAQRHYRLILSYLDEIDKKRVWPPPSASSLRSTSCALCVETSSPAQPDLSVNRILAEVSDNYRRTRPHNPPDEDVVMDVQQMIQERLQKIERLKFSFEVQKNSYLREVRESQKVFSALVIAIEKNHKAVIAEIEGRQREEEKRLETLVKELKQEIQELRRDTAESDSHIPAKCDQSDETKPVILNIVCPSKMKDWSTVTIETDPCIGVTRRALSDVMEMIKIEVNRLSKSELKRIEKYAVDVNLSAKTAHPVLSVSDDRKQVRHTNKLQEVPDNPKRFDRVANVLAKESFDSGRCYWEVEVADKIEWNLGVVRQSVNRKGKFTVCPANGFWTLSLKAGGQYIANTSPVTPLALQQRPRTVGVFLDYTGGHVSFYWHWQVQINTRKGVVTLISGPSPSRGVQHTPLEDTCSCSPRAEFNNLITHRLRIQCRTRHFQYCHRFFVGLQLGPLQQTETETDLKDQSI